MILIYGLIPPMAGRNRVKDRMKKKLLEDKEIYGLQKWSKTYTNRGL